jgi:hypothetical protein
MKEAPGSSETSVLARATRRNNPEDTILQERLLFKFSVMPEVWYYIMNEGNESNKMFKLQKKVI